MKQDDISRADTAYTRYMARQSALLAQRILAVQSGDNHWQDVLQSVCSEYHVLPQDVLGGSRVLPIQKARKACMRALYKRGHGVNQIGRWLNRDHATVSVVVTGRKVKGGQNPLD